MSLYKINISLHAIVLLGCIAPLGNIWGPLLIQTDDLALKRNKTFIIRFQILLSIFLMILGFSLWLIQTYGLVNGKAIKASRLPQTQPFYTKK